MPPDKVAVLGLRELAGAFRKIDRELPKELRDKMKAIAETVASSARSKVPSITGVARGSIRARATQRGAGIAFPAGGARGKDDYYPWLDFGGTTGRGHRPRRYYSGSISREWMGNPAGEGRYVYPAIREARPMIEYELDRALVAVAERASFETRGRP